MQHLIQPLDVGIYNAFKSGVKRLLRETLPRPTTHMTGPQLRNAFLVAAVSAVQASCTQHAILTAFKCTGIWPISEEAVLKNPLFSKTQDIAAKLEEETKKRKRRKLTRRGYHFEDVCGTTDEPKAVVREESVPEVAAHEDDGHEDGVREEKEEEEEDVEEHKCYKRRRHQSVGIPETIAPPPPCVISCDDTPQIIGAGANVAGCPAKGVGTSTRVITSEDYGEYEPSDDDEAASDLDLEVTREEALAERDRRIAEAEKEVGRRLVLREVAGDGTCQFHAIAVALRSVGGRHFKDGHELRRAMCDWIEQQLADTTTTVGQALAGWEFLDTRRRSITAQAWLRQMRQNRWGDEYTLVAISTMLSIEIRTILFPTTATSSWSTTAPIHAQAQHTIWLVNDRQSSHYSALIPQTQNLRKPSQRTRKPSTPYSP